METQTEFNGWKFWWKWFLFSILSSLALSAISFTTKANSLLIFILGLALINFFAWLLLRSYIRFTRNWFILYIFVSMIPYFYNRVDGPIVYLFDKEINGLPPNIWKLIIFLITVLIYKPAIIFPGFYTQWLILRTHFQKSYYWLIVGYLYGVLFPLGQIGYRILDEGFSNTGIFFNSDYPLWILMVIALIATILAFIAPSAIFGAMLAWFIRHPLPKTEDQLALEESPA